MVEEIRKRVALARWPGISGEVLERFITKPRATGKVRLADVLLIIRDLDTGVFADQNGVGDGASVLVTDGPEGWDLRNDDLEWHVKNKPATLARIGAILGRTELT